jgi:hypothetical protein
VSSTVEVRGTRALRYDVNVEYEYEIDGATYRSDERHYGPQASFRDKALAERVLAGYPEGGSVTVYCDPRDRSGVLEPGLALPGVQKGVTIFCACLLLVGILLGYLGLRPARRLRG